jgi:outer membrane protein OmpA-like peptidoglycan-associated protein
MIPGSPSGRRGLGQRSPVDLSVVAPSWPAARHQPGAAFWITSRSLAAGLAVFSLAAVLTAAHVHASQVELGGGLAQPGLNQTEQPWAVGTALRLGYLHPLSERWWFAALGSYTRFLNDTLSSSTIKFSFPNHNADQRWQVLSLDLGTQVILDRSSRLAPYARGTIGAAFWNVKYLDGEPVQVSSESGAPTDFSAQEVVLRGALGLTYQVSPPVGLSVELEGAYFTGLGADFSAATDEARSRGVATILFKISYDLAVSSGDVRITDASPAVVPPAAATQLAPSDLDSDGVPDLVDDCPGTPKAALGWVDVLGCPVDSDHDGVPDYLDRCPRSATHWPVDSSGCVPDEDSDGIPDVADSCAATPAGTRVDSAGCPDYPALTGTVVLRFDYPSGGTQLDADAQAQLRKWVPHLLYHPRVPIQICGYTDNIGAIESNLALSQKRALVVKEFLVAEGVPAAQLVAVGRGESNHVASNETREGRAQNRRIELIPLKK